MNAEAKAIKDWFDTDEAKSFCDGSTIGLPSSQSEFLYNRIHRAFVAGMAARVKIDRENEIVQAFLAKETP